MKIRGAGGGELFIFSQHLVLKSFSFQKFPTFASLFKIIDNLTLNHSFTNNKEKYHG